MTASHIAFCASACSAGGFAHPEESRTQRAIIEPSLLIRIAALSRAKGRLDINQRFIAQLSLNAIATERQFCSVMLIHRDVAPHDLKQRLWYANITLTRKTIYGDFHMIKSLFTVALGLSIALTVACSPKTEEASAPPTTATDDGPNLAALHADDMGEKIPVTLENYEVAESDLAFYNVTKLVGMNTFFHFPTGAFDLNNQTVVRMNRDTYYSAAVIDTTQGASITIPETNGRYLSVMVVQNDHYIDEVFLAPGTHEITSETEFAMVAMRIRANQSDPDDDAAIAALRAGVKLEVGGNGSHTRPNYDMEQLVALRDELTVEGTKLGTLMGMQGAHGTIEPTMHLYGTAIGWGLLPDAQAQYLGSPKFNNDGCYMASYPSPPFNDPGFFSITMYDAEGWIYREDGILNEFNMTSNEDGSFDAYFGECGDVDNHLPTVEGWNYILRIYEPKLEELENFRLPEMIKIS
ncbi:DUF1254 domain-containing protein [Luminiphilus sp.]|nr:DUF1254 domain-containing protein [Luminiphilus sp.]